MQRFEHSPLLYEEGFSVIINDVVNPPEESALYYFDYDSRSQDSHMKFPHSHRFYEIFILLSPRALHFVE